MMSEPTLDRRRFLGLVGAAGGLSLADPASAREVGGDDLEATLELERTVLEATVTAPVPTASGWDPQKLANQGAATLIWMGQARRLRGDETESMALREAVDDRLDGMLRTVWAMALELEAMDVAELAELERTLAEQPWVVEEAHARFTARALELDVALDDVDEVDRSLERVLWRMRKQGLAAVRDDLIEKLDRVERRTGTHWRELGRRGANQPFVRPRGRKYKIRQSVQMTATDYEQLARKQRASAGWLLGIGIVWLIPPLTIFGGICFGPPMVIVGIVKLVKAGKNMERAEALRAPQEG